MQREIKYRLWDKDLKVMIYPEDDISYEYSLLPSGEVRQQGNGLRNNLVIMLDTGLEDKNVVKIYENDFVQYLDNTSKGLVTKTVLIEDIRHLPDFSCARDLMFIGNIYENPELIK